MVLLIASVYVMLHIIRPWTKQLKPIVCGDNISLCKNHLDEEERCILHNRTVNSHDEVEREKRVSIGIT